MKVILALDIGTSSTRAALFDDKGNRVAETLAQVRYPLLTGNDGRAELSPETLNRAVTTVVEKALRLWRKKKSSRSILAVSVSCFWHSLLGLDAKGRPLTPIYTWADSRCRTQAELLRRNRGEIALHARTGCMARSSFWPAKLLWLRQTQPALFRRVVRWVSPAEWIQERFCGTATVSISMASGTGLLNGHNLRWHPALLHRCGVKPTQLSVISDVPGRISKNLSRRFSELSDASWYPAIGDGAASNIGSGATTPGVAAINIGTSAAMRVVATTRLATGKPLVPFGLFAYRVDERRRLLGGAVSNAGNLHAWSVKTLNLPKDSAALEKLTRSYSGAIENLTVLPFWLAERAPTWPEHVPSAILGITQATTTVEILLALQDATYLRLAQIAVELEKATKRKLTYVVSGGIRHSPSALQRLSNVLGRPVLLSHEEEASLRGAACFALEKSGVAVRAPKIDAIIKPDLKAARVYVKARERQVRLENLLQNFL